MKSKKAQEESLDADKIIEFARSKKEPAECRVFVRSLFQDGLRVPLLDPLWSLISYLENKTDFYSAPASTRFHGACECGLVRHSLLALGYCLKLAPVMLEKECDIYFLTAGALFHDLCKVNMYEPRLRNVKNEATGKWEKTGYYAVREDYISYGHGIESVMRINKYITLPPEWEHAVRWHMGAYDLSEQDSRSMRKALSLYREVLLLQTADMLAAIADGV